MRLPPFALQITVIMAVIMSVSLADMGADLPEVRHILMEFTVLLVTIALHVGSDKSEPLD